MVIALTVPKGLDKPCFDKNGVIWLKSGADKRRVNSKEELRRFFQVSDQFHADELPTKAALDKLDKLRFRDFLRDVYNQEYPDSPEALRQLLQNMNLATGEGMLNLAGVLMFAERPEWIKPQFVIKAIRNTPSISIPKLAAMFAVSTRTIERGIAELCKAGLLRRVGGGRGGRWEVGE